MLLGAHMTTRWCSCLQNFNYALVRLAILLYPSRAKPLTSDLWSLKHSHFSFRGTQISCFKFVITELFLLCNEWLEGGLDRTPKMMHAGHHRLCFQETNNSEKYLVGESRPPKACHSKGYYEILKPLPLPHCHRFLDLENVRIFHLLTLNRWLDHS